MAIIENKYLRKFVKRFDRGANRERIDNLSREFKEELVDKSIVNWNCISYRYCGRHITELHWGEHFQCYELLLADIIELLPTPEQENDLRNLMGQPSESAVGMSDANYFSRMFRKVEGISPREYRKQW